MFAYAAASIKMLAQALLLAIRSLWTALAVAIAVAAFTVPLSWWGWIGVICQLLIVLTFISPSSYLRLPRVAGIVAICVLTASLIGHALRAGTEFSVEYTILPDVREVDLLSRTYPEEDAISIASRILSLLGVITKGETQHLHRALNEQYPRMRGALGYFPTPLYSAAFGLERPSSSSLLSIIPKDQPDEPNDETTAVIFLHGAGGNWTLLCWLAAEPFIKHGMPVFCPSSWIFHPWVTKKGIAIFDTLLHELGRRGYKRFIFAGLSAGAIGATKLVDLYPGRFEAAVLLFGTHSSQVQIQIPTLVVYGIHDERFPSDYIERIGAAHKANFQNVELQPIDSDHFALLTQHAAVQSAIDEWLARAVSRLPD